MHLTADDRGFGHRVLRPVEATQGRDCGADTTGGMPRKAPSGPRAASRADARRQAARPAQRASRVMLGAFAVLGTVFAVAAQFRKGEGLPFPMMVVGLATFVVFLLKPLALTWHIWNGWNIVLVITNYLMLAKKGHLKPRRERHLKAA